MLSAKQLRVFVADFRQVRTTCPPPAHLAVYANQEDTDETGSITKDCIPSLLAIQLGFELGQFELETILGIPSNRHALLCCHFTDTVSTLLCCCCTRHAVVLLLHSTHCCAVATLGTMLLRCCCCSQDATILNLCVLLRVVACRGFA